MAVILRAIAFAAIVLCARPALAADGEKVFSLGVDYATWTVPQDIQNSDEDSITAQGGALGVDVLRGFGDSVWLRASGHGGVYRALGETSWDVGGTVGVRYAFDVLRYVPFLDLGVGGLAVGGGAVDTAFKPVVELGLGLDILESRTFSWGVVLRFDSFASQAVFLTAGARVSWRWGFF
jgi:hypothetical protein